jgi:hypothetical protein
VGEAAVEVVGARVRAAREGGGVGAKSTKRSRWGSVLANAWRGSSYFNGKDLGGVG